MISNYKSREILIDMIYPKNTGLKNIFKNLKKNKKINFLWLEFKLSLNGLTKKHLNNTCKHDL